MTKDKFGKLDVAVSCAGIGVAFKTYNFNKKLPHKLEDFNKVLSVSVSGGPRLATTALCLVVICETYDNEFL